MFGVVIQFPDIKIKLYLHVSVFNLDAIGYYLDQTVFNSYASWSQLYIQFGVNTPLQGVMWVHHLCCAAQHTTSGCDVG